MPDACPAGRRRCPRQAHRAQSASCGPHRQKVLYLRGAGRPHLHRDHRAHQGGGLLRRRQGHPSCDLRRPMHRKCYPIAADFLPSPVADRASSAKKRPVFCRRANLAAAMPRHALNQLPFAPLDFAGRHGAGRKSSDITKGWGSHPIPLPMYPPDGLNQLRLLLHGAGHGLDVLYHRLRMDGGNLFGKRRLHFRACGIMHDNAQRTSPLPGKAVYASALVPHALFGQGGTPPLHALSQQAALTVAAGPVSPEGRGVTGPRRNVSFPYIILFDIILLACNSSCSLPWRSCCQAVRLPEIFALRKGRPPAVPCVRCSCVQDGNAPCHRPGRGICGAGIGAEATGRERPCRRSRPGPAEILPCSLRTSLWQLGRACAIMCYNIRKSIPEAMGGGDRVAARTENRFGLFPGAVVFGGAFCHLYV